MRGIREIDPRHKEVRGVLRIVGPLVLAAGLLLLGIGVASFFSSMGSFEPPRFFWCAFLGIPVLFLGLVLSAPAFLGSTSRFLSAEVAPVQKDTFNYLASGTSEGVRTLAEAVGQGFAAGAGAGNAGIEQTVPCPKCQAPNQPGAQFCAQCGADTRPKACPSCKARNEPTARYCNQCGTALA